MEMVESRAKETNEEICCYNPDVNLIQDLLYVVVINCIGKKGKSLIIYQVFCLFYAFKNINDISQYFHPKSYHFTEEY